MGNENKTTALHIAVNSGSVKMLEILLNKGADVNGANEQNHTPLILAIQKGNSSVATILLKNNAKFENNILHQLMEQNLDIESDILNILVQYGLNINQKDENDQTALNKAVKKNDIQASKILLENGANLENIALHKFVQDNNLEMLQLLTKYDIDVDIENEDGDTALQLATSNYTPQIIESLLKNGANTKGVSLHLFVEKNDIKMIDLLLHSGVDINKKDENDQTALNKAVNKNDIQISEILLEQGASLENITLHKSVQDNNLEMLQILTKYNINVDIKNEYGRTALIEAVEAMEGSNNKIVEVLLASNASVVDVSLLFPIRCNNIDLVKLLIQHGIDVNIPLTKGMSALTYAMQNKSLELIKLLIDNGANTEGIHIHEFAMDGNNEAIEIFLDAGVNINALNNKSQSLLSIAIAENNIDLVNVLLLRDANIDEMALSNAISDQNINLIEQLVQHDAEITDEHYFKALRANRLDIFKTLYKKPLLKTPVHEIKLFDNHNPAILTLQGVESFSLGMTLIYKINNDTLIDEVLRNLNVVKRALSLEYISL